MPSLAIQSIAPGGCKASPGGVLSRPDGTTIGAPRVLAWLAFRSPEAGQHYREGTHDDTD
jgi:hypothetical protein